MFVSIGILTIFILKFSSADEKDAENDKCALRPGPAYIHCYLCHYSYNDKAHNEIPENDGEPSCIPTPEAVEKATGLKPTTSSRNLELTPDIATTARCPLSDHRYCMVTKFICFKGILDCKENTS